MSVTVRPYVTGGWEVDIRVVLPDGTVIRERRKAQQIERVFGREMEILEDEADRALRGVGLEERLENGSPEVPRLLRIVADRARERALFKGKP